MRDLRSAVRARYLELNGTHEMTSADDAYVTEYFVPLNEVAEANARTSDQIRQLMLDRKLPLPSYLRSDGTEMVPRDLLDLAAEAGGVAALPGWFKAHWSDPVEGSEEWDAYLSGQYVCLYSVTPENIRRKDELTSKIETELSRPNPSSPQWLENLHGLVDALDSLEPPFTAYDRGRFGAPTSREAMIDALRAQYPRESQATG